MLSDCIISTGEYLAKSGKRNAISDEKLIKSIFSNRIAKGSLAESGLTDEQLEQLQDYFVEHAFSSKEREPV
jgi:membrane-associated HD superfamily phosphohydrolase